MDVVFIWLLLMSFFVTGLAWWGWQQAFTDESIVIRFWGEIDEVNRRHQVLERRLERANKRIDELEVALIPFANVGKEIPDDWSDEFRPMIFRCGGTQGIMQYGNQEECLVGVPTTFEYKRALAILGGGNKMT